MAAHRLGGRHRRSQPRPLAALGYLANGPVIDGLIEVEKLTIYYCMTSRLVRATAPFVWPVIPAAASRGASASAAPRIAGSSRTSPSSRSPRPGVTDSIWPARNC